MINSVILHEEILSYIILAISHYVVSLVDHRWMLSDNRYVVCSIRAMLRSVVRLVKPWHEQCTATLCVRW